MNTTRFRLPALATAGAALLLLAATSPVQAADAHYARRGEVYRTLPHEAITIAHRGGPYYYRGGEWYRPYGGRYRVVAPPLGVVVPFLPGVYSTLWFGGVPYYFANDAYYLWRPELNGYVVTAPPAGAPAEPAASAPAADDPFVYPKNGQTESQQATDRYECHRWAADQTSFDPTVTGAAGSATTSGAKRADYLRAMTACLEGRGYSVK